MSIRLIDRTPVHRRWGTLGLLMLLLSTVLSILGPPTAHAESRDGWCKQGEGMAVVIDFASLSATHWPNSKGYVVRCIVDPRVAGDTPSELLQAAGIAHTGTTYIDSILGLRENVEMWGWVRGRNLPGTLSWQAMTVELPDPQVNGFAYFYAKSSMNDMTNIPSVLPQFAPSGGGGNGGGDGVSLIPGAPQQPGGGGSGGGDQLNPQAPVQPGQPSQTGQAGQAGQQGQTGQTGQVGQTGQATVPNQPSDILTPGAPTQAPIAPESPNAAAMAAETASQAPNDPQQASSPPAVFSSEEPHQNAETQPINQNGNWLWALGGLGVVVLGVGAGFGLRALNSRKPGQAPVDGD